MRQPEGFMVEGKEHLVCQLKCSIYGLKQSKVLELDHSWLSEAAGIFAI